MAVLMISVQTHTEPVCFMGAAHPLCSVHLCTVHSLVHSASYVDIYWKRTWCSSNSVIVMCELWTSCLTL